MTPQRMLACAIPVTAAPAIVLPAMLTFACAGFAQTGRDSALTGKTLFQLLPPSRTGITFCNKISENDSLNILNQANIYNGGGVGIGDFNNDGLPDIFLSGNMVSSKLYFNRCRLPFQDVTDRPADPDLAHRLPAP